MASTAYCVYCFEVLSASLERRHALDFKQVKSLWAQYQAALELGHDEGEEEELEDVDGGTGEEEDAEMTEDDEDDEEGDNEATASTQRTLRPREISRLQAPSPASGSTSSTPSTLSATSSQTGFSDASKASSKSSFFSFARRSPVEKEEEYPLFVTWNTLSHRGHNKSLRGCIGTFEAQALSGGLRSYALTSAFDDTRFTPITLSEVPTLSNSITLLANFTPCSSALDWDLGTHGVRISFTYHGKRYGATYLPDVAVDQGWTKEETIISLMRKAGWAGRSSDWKKIPDMRCVRYEGKKASIDHREWKDWRSWVDSGAAKNR